MISSPKTPQREPDVGNVQHRKLASNQRAVALPYYAGRAWLPIKWAQSAVYNPRTSAVTQKVGKSKQVTGYDYYGDLFGLLACCLTDYVEALEVNGRVVWADSIARDGAHVHHTGDVIIPGVLTFRLHWGTEDAAADWLVLGTCGETHPLYLDQAKIEIKDCYFGNNNATPPTIRVLVERAARFTGLPEDRTREGTNGVTTIAEVIGNDWFGLARPDLIHVATWAPLAAAIRRDTPVAVPGDPDHLAAMGFISPYADRIQPAQSFLARILEIYDAWLRRLDDKIEIGRFPHDGVIPEDIEELDHHDFIAPPTFDADDDSDGQVITDAIVTHLERDNNMEEDSQPATNLAARERLGDIREKAFARPFIVTGYQAREQANELAKFYSRPEEKCSVQIRRERIVGLRAGSRFILNDAPSSERIVVRIVSRRDDSDGGRVSLSLVAERGLAPLGYVPVPQPQPTLPSPDLVTIVNARMFQLPTLFADYGPAPAAAALAERPAAHTAGFTVHFSTAGVTFDEIATVGRWALRGALAAAILANALTFTVNAAGFDIALLQAQSDAAKNDNTLLLVCGYEVMSIGIVTALGGGQYELTVFRGRRGSVADAHAAASGCYIIPRADLVVLQHADFPRAIANRYFKLATYTTGPEGGDEQELADALPLTLGFDDTTVDAPGTFAALAKAEAIWLSWTYPTPPDDLTIIGTDIWELAAAIAPNPLTDPPTHTLRATGWNRGGLAAGTTKYYYALNRDRIGTRSALVGPVDATAAAAPTGPAGAIGATGAAGAAGAAGSTGAPGATGPAGINGLDGSVTFYSVNASVPTALAAGDLWFVTDKAFELRRATAAGTGSWVTTLYAGSAPFEIISGTTYIKKAAIREVDAGVIIAGNITVALVLTTGSLSSGTGANEVAMNSSGLRVGATTGSHVKIFQYAAGHAGVMLFNSAGALRGAFVHNGDTVLLGGAGANDKIQDFAECRTTKLVANGTTDPRSNAAPLRSDGGCWIEKSLDVRGQTFLNDHLNLPNGANIYCGGDIKLGLAGVERWIYDGDNNRVVRKRYATANPGASSDLATAISLANWCRDLLIYQGLGS